MIARFPNMTRREESIFRCLAKGMSNTQTAEELKLEVSTVKVYISKLYKKYNVTRYDATRMLAVDQGRVQAIKLNEWLIKYSTTITPEAKVALQDVMASYLIFEDTDKLQKISDFKVRSIA